MKFTTFSPAISPAALKAKGARLREMRIGRRTDLSLDQLARWLNPIIAGWMRYYGRFYRSALYPLLQRISTYLRRWAGKKYRRLGPSRGSRGGGPGYSKGSPAYSPTGAGFARFSLNPPNGRSDEGNSPESRRNSPESRL